MSYQTQPGTLPHRVVQFLQLQPAGFEISTPDLAEVLEADTQSLAACLQHPRSRGVLQARQLVGGRALLWSLGDGKPPCQSAELAQYDAKIDSMQVVKSQRQPASREFRALMWEGQLLATGMQIIDGVAVFTPGMVQAIKQQTDWAAAP